MPTGVYKRKSKPIRERFESKFVKGNDDECWEWQARISPFGYGQFAINPGNIPQAHRFSYELYLRKIPKGMCVLHRCDNRKCVNPKHLWLGTQQENIKDMILKKRDKKATPDKNGGAKLTWEQVNEIRKIRREKGTYYKDLAKMFNVHYATIKRIILKKSW
jgi:hypothetical protein